MAINQQRIITPMLRQIVNRPRLADVLFKFDKWGNPFNEARYSDPYRLGEVMRKDGNLVYRPLYQLWFALGHDEVTQLLAHPDVTSRDQMIDFMEVRPYNRMRPRTQEFFLQWMLLNDPPDHGRLRKLVSRTFTPRRIADLEPRTAEVTQQLLQSLRGRDTLDVATEFNDRLPINVISAMLGVPPERWDWMRETATLVSLFLNPFDHWDYKLVDSAVAELDDYILELAAERRANPQDDLISALAEVAEDGDRLSDKELVANVGLLMFAGYDTTSSMLGNAIVALARNPEQRDLVRANPELWPNAIEELLRYDGPIGTGQRRATADITIGDQTIPAGADIAVIVGAANRDPGRWDRADELILDREDPRPVTFGHGIHYCVGAALARMELRVGLSAFIDEFGDYTIDESTLEWRHSVALKGPSSLTVTRGA